MLDKLLHKYLKLPYGLHVHEYRRAKGAKKTVIFLHGIGSSGSMWKTVASKQLDANIIIIDLLGFGQSPAPAWARYDARLQARAVSFTLTRLGITKPVIVVGHSMGALVAVEFASKYPRRVESLILCSPPFYRQNVAPLRRLPTPESMLRKLYLAVQSNPLQFSKLTTFATKYKLVNEGFNVTSDNIETYIAALEGMILNQTSFDDTLRLEVPTHIIRGSLDPFVLAGNLKLLKKQNSYITITTVAAGHEIRGLFLRAISKKLNSIVTPPM